MLNNVKRFIPGELRVATTTVWLPCKNAAFGGVWLTKDTVILIVGDHVLIEPRAGRPSYDVMAKGVCGNIHGAVLEAWTSAVDG